MSNNINSTICKHVSIFEKNCEPKINDCHLVFQAQDFYSFCRQRETWQSTPFSPSLGESLKKPTLFESMSDILELEEGSGGGGAQSAHHQTHHPPQPPNAGGGSSSRLQGGCGGQSSATDATTTGGENGRAVPNNNDQQSPYLHHNCNPRQIKNVNAMSIETDV